MQLNLQVEGNDKGKSGQVSNSDDGQFDVALTEKQVEVMVIRTVERIMEPLVIRTIQRVIEPTMEDLFRRLFKEAIQSAVEKFVNAGNRTITNEVTVPEEKSLQLKFLDEVSIPVLTGKEIKGTKGEISLAIVDKITGQAVASGPESSAKVEIFVLDANDDDNADKWTHQDFTNRIIMCGNKKKPHFVKQYYVSLKAGIGTLSNVKLGNDSGWTYQCKCRLGARVGDSCSGVQVQEAWTEPFVVSDNRSKRNEKHYPPQLSDPVWRLEMISKEGHPCKRLKKENVSTVQDLLILHNTDPQRLQQILGNGKSAKKWDTAIEHARCVNLDKKVYSFCDSQHNTVAFNIVGDVMGISSNGQFIPIDNLSEAQKEEARQMVVSAFANKERIVTIPEETSLNAPTPLISPTVQSFPDLPSEHNCTQSLKAWNIGQCSYCPESPSPPRNIYLTCSPGESFNLADHFNNVDPKYFTLDDLSVSYHVPANSLIRDTHSMDIAFSAGELLQDLPPIKGWTILFSILRWWFSIRRIVARTSAR